MFLCASAIGYYGNGGDRIVDEIASPVNGFISEVRRLWEKVLLPCSSDTTTDTTVRQSCDF